MANVVVPEGMVPGPEGYPLAFEGPSLCDIGPNPQKLWPSSWVDVKIVPDGLVTPDSFGRQLHCLWTFARPTVGYGKRRQFYPAWQPADVIDSVEPLQVETDPGTFFVGTDVSLAFVGGTPGDAYLVDVSYSVPRAETDPELAIDVYEDAFKFRLTSEFFREEADFIDFPNAPDWHTHFGIISGAAEIQTATVVVPITNPLTGGGVPPPQVMPLNLGRFRVSTGIFFTQGAV